MEVIAHMPYYSSPVSWLLVIDSQVLFDVFKAVASSEKGPMLASPTSIFRLYYCRGLVL